jgi:hypothetical protein
VAGLRGLPTLKSAERDHPTTFCSSSRISSAFSMMSGRASAAFDAQGGQQAAVDLAEEGSCSGGVVAVFQDHGDRAVGLCDGLVQA